MLAISTATRCRDIARPNPDDTGALAMAMLLILVGMSLSALLVPIVVLQSRNTTTSVDSQHALHAAQAGLDVAVGEIRAATDASGRGSLSGLPCGPVRGSVGDGSGGTYAVTFAYLDSNPQGGWTSSDALACPVSTQPSYVQLVSIGADGTTTRSVRATYTFRTTNANILGGHIHVFPIAGNPDLCIDAGPGTPAPGTAVTVKPCVAGSPAQAFGYYTDLSLVLVSSHTKPSAAAPYGLCLEAGVTQADGDVVRLQPCSASAPGHQRWGFTDDANFAGTTDTMVNTNLCINVRYSARTAGDLIIGSCTHMNDNIGVFAPDPEVGAGAAGLPITDASGVWRQLVNFQQFSRCLDVPLFNTDAGYLIAWPCKQGTTNVSWNQKWQLPNRGPGQVKIYHPSAATTYCLQSPLGPVGSYVALLPCGTATPATTWTVVGTSTGVWDTGYRIIDSSGRCLAAKDEGQGDYFDYGFHVSKIIVDTCSTTSPDNELQHWDAPPNVDPPSPLTDIAER